MDNIEHLHGSISANNHPHAHGRPKNKAPFWVRQYDTVVNLVTLGRTRTVHKQTLSLANLCSGDAVLDIGCGTGMLLHWR